MEGEESQGTPGEKRQQSGNPNGDTISAKLTAMEWPAVLQGFPNMDSPGTLGKFFIPP